jgi:hypothetical protein
VLIWPIAGRHVSVGRSRSVSIPARRTHPAIRRGLASTPVSVAGRAANGSNESGTGTCRCAAARGTLRSYGILLALDEVDATAVRTGAGQLNQT